MGWYSSPGRTKLCSMSGCSTSILPTKKYITTLQHGARAAPAAATLPRLKTLLPCTGQRHGLAQGVQIEEQHHGPMQVVQISPGEGHEEMPHTVCPDSSELSGPAHLSGPERQGCSLKPPPTRRSRSATRV